MDPDHFDAASLARELLPRLRRWDSASWSVPAVLPGGTRRTRAELAAAARPGRTRPTRAEVAAATLQRLADAGADAEGQPRRPVPLLADVNLADQLTVLVDDILRTGDPAALRAAATELAALRAALGYR
jgi:hypothetical protein